jgi:hypothetical protein
LRPIVTRGELAVLELRGGTHVDAAHRDYAERGLSPSPVRRGRIHDSFDLAVLTAGLSRSTRRTPAGSLSKGTGRRAVEPAHDRANRCSGSR